MTRRRGEKDRWRAVIAMAGGVYRFSYGYLKLVNSKIFLKHKIAAFQAL
jgi:hypothetical protein